MSEAQERARPRSSRRFRLPPAADEGVGEKIEAFIHGAPARTRTRTVRRVSGDDTPRAIQLDNRQDWSVALHRESSRVARYGRPAAVVAVTLEPSRPGMTDAAALDRLAGPIGHTLAREARESDLVTRVSPTRFHVLLPETSQAEAARYIDRVIHACELWFAAAGLPVRLRAVAASPGPGQRLEDALALADANLGGAGIATPSVPLAGAATRPVDPGSGRGR
jgi:GGDEF domain-containing protein